LPDWWNEVVEDASTKKIIYNAQFDLTWMIDDAAKKGALLGAARNIADPMLKSQLANTYRTRTGAAKAGRPTSWQPNDLAYNLEKYLGTTIEKGIDHSVTDWTGPWSSEMEDYMLEDIDELAALDTMLDREMIRQGQERAAWIEQDVVFGTAWMTYNGITPDVDRWTASIAEWREQHEHLLWHLKREFPGVENFNSPAQLVAASAEVLGGPLLNTKKATLKQLAPAFPAIEMLLEQRHFQTRLKNWGPHYLAEYVCQICGRFHPNWRQIGTETARFSCSKPNLQQIPRDPAFRSLFVAAPGCLIVSLDYSAIEVVTAAVFAECPSLLAACATGNPHGATAAMMLGLTFEAWEQLPYAVQKDSRQSAKIANFGLLFGGGVDALIVQARDLFNVILSRPQAEKMFADFFRFYPELRRSRGWAYEAMKAKDRRIEVRNAVNFRRLLEGYNFKPTSWLNTWIQSTAGYGLKASFKYLREAGLLPFLCAQVHDELLFEFPEEDAPQLAEQAQACMVVGMREVLGERVPVTVEIEIGSVWSS
jgi:DNA polymerase-1